MRATFLLLCLLATTAVKSWGQAGYAPAYPFEVGIIAGTSVFMGDLGGNKGKGKSFLKDADLRSLRPNLGLFGRYNLGAHFALRADLSFMMLAGDDAWANNGFNADNSNRGGGDDAFFRYYRNLSFRSRVFEALVVGEIIAYNFELGGGYQGYSVLSPYAVVGIGVFNFKPQAYYDGQWVDLQPLSTEGQGLISGRAKYKTTELCLPLGAGIRWSYNDVWSIGIEFTHRLTFTDYIDDVSTNYVNPQVFYDNFEPGKAALATALAQRSNEIDPSGVNRVISAPGEQRGDPKDNDSYFTTTIRVSYFLPPGAFGGGRSYGCPVW